MPKTMEKTIYQLVAEYANMVGPLGPDSDQVRRFRADHADNAELMEYADALDRIKRHFSDTSSNQVQGISGKLVGC